MSIDLLYVAYNRLPFTIESFEALLINTDWQYVERLFIADDGSSDGTYEYLDEAAGRSPVKVEFCEGRFGGPVSAMNWYLDNRSEIDCDNVEHTDASEECWRCQMTGRASIETFAKIDNDFIVCPGWLREMIRVMDVHSSLDVLGTEPMHGPSAWGVQKRDYEECTHIGGKGLIRSRIFNACRPVPHGKNGYQGWSQYQGNHPFSRGWIKPELPTFGIDQLPFEPWRSLADSYEERGWSRSWQEYREDMHDYWDWWTSVTDGKP